MRKNILKSVHTSQVLKLLKHNCNLKFFYLTSHLTKYGVAPIAFHKLRSTRFVSSCLIQGKYKRTLKVCAFNRHLVRNGVLKDHFSNLSSSSW